MKSAVNDVSPRGRIVVRVGGGFAITLYVDLETRALTTFRFTTVLGLAEAAGAVAVSSE